jgi:hypothetical protein
MENLEYWLLCDELSLTQAAMLIFNFDPSKALPNIPPTGYHALTNALVTALRRGTLKGRRVGFFKSGEEVEDSVDPDRSTIEVDSLREWLNVHRLKPEFFFPLAKNRADCLDRNNPRYAPKLAAAVEAWVATGSESRPYPMSPKKFLEQWLTRNYKRLELVNEDGEPNASAIEEIAKVANWDLKGGAPKTVG